MRYMPIPREGETEDSHSSTVLIRCFDSVSVESVVRRSVALFLDLFFSPLLLVCVRFEFFLRNFWVNMLFCAMCRSAKLSFFFFSECLCGFDG